LKTRVLIVDDEPIARRGIRRYLAEHNGIEIAGEAANGISAVEQINELHPDIVFLDVQMPDLDGFGVIENVEPVNGPAPIYIFVTAHDVHAIRAFEVHAVDYLLKPYDKERFAKALVHARQVLEQRAYARRQAIVGNHGAAAVNLPTSRRTAAMVRAISSSVVARPRLKRSELCASSRLRPSERSTCEGSSEPAAHADPLEQTIPCSSR